MDERPPEPLIGYGTGSVPAHHGLPDEAVPGAEDATGLAEDTVPHEERPREGGGGGTLRWILETVFLLAAAFLLAQGVRAYVVQPFVIPTGSMEPTIAIEDRVLVNKFIYRLRDVQPGDVVVFDDPTGDTPALIKRVIAVAGQTVDVRDGRVYVDDVALDEPYTHDRRTEAGTIPLPTTVPEGQVWVMGDNRPNSKDSRFLGAQPVTAVQGQAFGVYWPIERIGGL